MCRGCHENGEACARGLKVEGELCPLTLQAPRTEEGAAAWSLALQPGVWRYGQSTVGAGLAGSITRQVATGVNMDEALTRLGSCDRLFREGVARMLIQIEQGRALAEEANTQALRDSGGNS